MWANLRQLPPGLWVVAIIVILVVASSIIWARRRKLRVTKVEVTTGPVKTTLELGDAKAPSATAAPPDPASVTIRGNWLFGKNRIGVRREKTDVSSNLMAGENEIEVGAKPGPKPKSRRTNRQ